MIKKGVIFTEPTAITGEKGGGTRQKTIRQERHKATNKSYETSNVKPHDNPEWKPNPQKKELTDEQKLDQLAKKSDNVLFRTKTIFPFTLFPDEIVVTEEKVTIIQKIFFFSEHVRGVLGKDIANVTVETNIFFGTLIIVDKYFTQDPIIVPYLWKSEAMKIRRILQGMVVAGNQGIDVTKLDVPHIDRTLEDIGKAHP